MGIKHYDAKTVTFRDIDITVMRLSEISGMHPSTLTARVKAGWNIEAAAIALPADLVRAPTSNVWMTEPKNKKKADALYKKIKAEFTRKPKKLISVNKGIPDRATIQMVLDYLHPTPKEDYNE